MLKIANNAIFNDEIIPYSINKLGNKEELDCDIIWNKKHELKLKKAIFQNPVNDRTQGSNYQTPNRDLQFISITSQIYVYFMFNHWSKAAKQNLKWSDWPMIKNKLVMLVPTANTVYLGDLFFYVMLAHTSARV